MKNSQQLQTDHSLLNVYFKEISKYKILDNSEINELINKAHEGDQISKDKVIKSNLRFVITIAKKFQGRGIPLMDLISEGTSGLIHSIDLFDVSRGVPFISYAVYWIKQHIYQSIFYHGREIRLPVSAQNKIVKILKFTKEYSDKYDRKPSVPEISKETGISESDIDFLAQYSNKLISVDDFIGGDSENNQVCDIIPDGERLLDDQVNDKFRQSEMIKLLDRLSVRERDIITMLFGIGIPPVDNKKIARMYGIGTERVRQIKESGFNKLKQRFGNKLKNLL